MSEYAESINLYIDTSEAVSQIAKAKDNMLSLKKAAEDTGVLLSDTFGSVITHLKRMQEEIVKTNTSASLLKGAISEVSA